MSPMFLDCVAGHRRGRYTLCRQWLSWNDHGGWLRIWFIARMQDPGSIAMVVALMANEASA